MAKIGILGGTFNPIHVGHLKLAENAYNQLNLDKVLIIPTGISYLKSNDNVLSKEIRADMVKLAIKEYPYFEFSDIELNRSGNTYTYETLEELKLIYPYDDLYFIIGADTLFNIESWKKPESIISNCILTVMVRDDNDITDVTEKCNVLMNKYNAKAVVLNSEKIDVSSSDIRKMISDKCYEKALPLLKEDVYNYILNNQLYD